SLPANRRSEVAPGGGGDVGGPDNRGHFSVVGAAYIRWHEHNRGAELPHDQCRIAIAGSEHHSLRSRATDSMADWYRGSRPRCDGRVSVARTRAISRVDLRRRPGDASLSLSVYR